MDPNSVIDALGGTTEVARLFEINPASVSEWRRQGIPKARLQTLRLLRPDLFNQPATKTAA
jgi:transposase-like protein